MILGSLLRQLKQGIYFYFFMCFVKLYKMVVGSHGVCFSTILFQISPDYYCCCPSALPQNVARYRGPNRANYMEACHIKTNSKQPDTSGHFLMVFSIFNHFGLHFSFIHVYLKCLITRENNSFTLRQINHYFFSIFCINWSCLPGSGSVFLFM